MNSVGAANLNPLIDGAESDEQTLFESVRLIDVLRLRVLMLTPRSKGEPGDGQYQDETDGDP